MTRPPAVLVFDVNETLIDIESMAPLFEEIFGDPHALRRWFGQLVMYSMTTALSGCYVDFFSLGQAMLRMLADIDGRHIGDAELDRIKRGMLTMPAHPDVAEGLSALLDDGFRLVTLTNSPPNPDGASPLEHAGLGGLFERKFSVDACRTFKPDPAVYRYVCRELDVVPADCMMVAAHVWDTIGAQAVGYSGALITRPGNVSIPLAGLPQPSLVASDIRELAVRLREL
jgi:2-haloacid dehalogenase